MAPEEAKNLSITTLGEFSIRAGGIDITDDSPRAGLMWKLFKYLITNRRAPVPTDKLIDVLWPNGECENELKALYSLIYRLRGLLKKHFGDPKPEFISFNRNCYIWNPESPFRLDALEFERLYARADEPTLTQAQRRELLHQAFLLYRGDYLPESEQEDWVIPPMTYYRRMYTRTVQGLCDICAASGDFAGIVGYCERAVTIAPLEESHHIALINALIELGQLSQAQAHYDHIAALLYKELGVSPSGKLLELHRRIYHGSADTQYDILAIKASLSADKSQAKSAFLCDIDTFRYIYQLELRTMERSGLSVYLACISLTDPSGCIPAAEPLASLMAELKASVAARLRRGDVMTQYSRTQLLLLLSCRSYEAGMTVLRRLEKAYYAECGKPYKLTKSLITVTADE